MRHVHVGGSRPFSLARAFAPAFVISLVSCGTAFAQSMPFVRVTHDKTEISSWRTKSEVRMRAPKGTVLEVFYIEGDRYAHRDSNWYWVLLPPDKIGNRPVGWIKGDDVELVPAPKPSASLADAGRSGMPAARPVRNEPRTSTSAIAAVETAVVDEAPAVAAVRPFVSDVVLNFEFNRSELTDDAKRTLSSAITKPSKQARYLSVALEGHADWIGSDDYNERLGLARAESVKQYLAEQLRIPADQISVTSYGETSPAAPNTTREGRARNRRVVIKAGA